MDFPSYKLPPLLAGIQTPEDLKRLPAEKLPELAAEVREVLIRTLATTGGHLAPNLGVVELSIALHRVFETPRDKILFDVSHQCYVHKMFTGRAAAMGTIRQFGGYPVSASAVSPSTMPALLFPPVWGLPLRAT